MDITVKCPNCFQQVSKENRFCIFCGCDISGVSSAPVPVSPSPDPEKAPAPPEEKPESYHGPRFCPRGHEVPDPSLGFCLICGSPLVDAPSGEAVPTATPTADTSETRSEPVKSRIVRRCGECGYECDDPDLSFCPSCGVPFSAEKRAESTWRCLCGNENASDMNFCIACGKPKGRRPSEHPVPEPKTETVRIPRGMKPPTDSDLAPKAKYES